MVVRLSQVIDKDLLPNIEITAEQVSFEWSLHRLFPFNDSIDREQNSTLHGSVISNFSSLFDCKLSEFDMNCKKCYSCWVFNFWGRNDYFELIAPFGSNTNGDGHCH